MLKCDTIRRFYVEDFWHTFYEHNKVFALKLIFHKIHNSSK